ncbi:DUF1223 domain-containing protein [Piscinibacter terrae]|nr:DUF1223 domain-containing protein [Albitalea terrae]
MASSGNTAATLVELYTSEGCNSCPPADRWLSSLKSRVDVVPLAFHVDYWDRLGWKDRFGSAAFSQRQGQQLAVNGSRFAYTPQVVVDGADQRGGPRLPSSRHASPVAIEMTQAPAGGDTTASISLAAPAGMTLAAYWAVTESGHRSDVSAGENQGVTLLHDFVVRQLVDVPAWMAAPGQPHALRLPALSAPDHDTRIALVVLDGRSGKPLQALAMKACR